PRLLGRGAQGGGLLGEVDGGWAPGETAAAADAAGVAELLDPGAELVREPLPVALAHRRAEVLAGDVGVGVREARVPAAQALARAAVERGAVDDGVAEAGRAHHRAA